MVNPGPSSEGILCRQGGEGRRAGDNTEPGRSGPPGVLGGVGEQCWNRMKGKEGTVRGQKWKAHLNNQEEPIWRAGP